MKTVRASWERRLLGALVFLAALAAFVPALQNDFVSWDDFLVIRDNVGIRGLDVAHLRWMLSAATGPLWQPMTLLSLAFDYRLWNLDPWGYHLTNIALHASGALLFYALCLRLLGDVRSAALAALFFAVHPLRVESVAWATERKDVLSGLLLFAAVLLRLKSVAARRRLGWELAALLCYALSLSAKVIGVTLPLALLVLEIYPLKRLDPRPGRWLEKRQREVLLSLAPYAAVAAGSLWAALATARGAGLLHGLAARGAAWRAGQALDGLLSYPFMTLWPWPLSSYYPPRAWYGRLSWAFWWRAAAAVAAAWGTARLARRRPGASAALACYAVLFLPISGLVQEGMLFSVFDRYTYVPCLPFAVLFGAAFRTRAGAALAAGWLCALAAVSWTQCGAWRDTLTLWSTAQRRAPSGFALSNAGVALVEAGREREGLDALRRAVAEYPGGWSGYDNLGVALERGGDRAGALAIWREGLRVKDAAELRAHLGFTLASGSDAEFEEGLADLRAAVALNPRYAPWRLSLGDALARAGSDKDAEAEYDAASSLDPRLGQARNNWGLLLARQGRLDEARAQYRAALALPDARAEANYNLGNLLLARGEEPRAEGRFREALRLKPAFAQAGVNLGNIFARRGRFVEAERLYRAALKTRPDLVEARANLAAVERLLGR